MSLLNENIRCLRLNSGISQIDLANRLNVSKQCVSNWENDNVLPSITMLIQLADYFGVSADYLLGRNDRRTLDVTGITDEEIAHLNLFIKDLKNSKNRNS